MPGPPGTGVLENKHSADVESLLLLRAFTCASTLWVKPCSNLGRVLVVNDPAGRRVLRLPGRAGRVRWYGRDAAGAAAARGPPGRAISIITEPRHMMPLT